MADAFRVVVGVTIGMAMGGACLAIGLDRDVLTETVLGALAGVLLATFAIHLEARLGRRG